MKIAVLAGDGVGPEVMAESLRVLECVSKKFNHKVEINHALIGGSAFDTHGVHLPEETLETCKKSDAILFGSVGGPLNESHLPKWKGCEVNALLGIRKAFNFYANLRPCDVYPELSASSPLKDKVIKAGASILIIRELIGDIYFGEKKRELRAEKRYASDLAEYNETQISNIAKIAFESARKRKSKVTSVDKANVLETSRLWREVVTEVSKNYSDVSLEHMLVDNCAMQLVKNPSQFDVLLCSNMFGDILSDIGSVLPALWG